MLYRSLSLREVQHANTISRVVVQLRDIRYVGGVRFVSLLYVVINVTLPDEKQNYVHRIGRVGRADR